MVVQNDRFGWRFFPKKMARSPSPLRFDAEKQPGVRRIFVFGESAALGDPRPGYGLGRQLQVLLEERNPGTAFEVICVAMTAINSHAILPIARECMRYGGDYWVIYMGNNEMEGPFGANTIFGPRAPRLGFIRATVALRSTRLGQLLLDLGKKTGTGTEDPGTWEGMKMFLKQQLPADDTRRETVRTQFRRNLEEIIDAGLACGAVPIVCTVAGNLKDCAPFASLNGSGLPDGDRAAWLNQLERSAQLQQESKWEEAGRLLENLERKDPLHAEAHYRRGQVAWQTGDTVAAKQFFEQARDTDALPFRTDGPLNAVVREVAARRADRGVRLVDAEGGLAKDSPGGVAGGELFFDHVHLTPDGNHRLARHVAEVLQAALPAAVTSKATPNWAGPDVCNRRLGLTDWNRLPALESMLQRLSDAPFTNQVNHPERERLMVSSIVQLRSRVKSGDTEAARALYLEAITRRPEDPRLRENRAEFLEATGSLEEAMADWRVVSERWPHHYQGFYQSGRLLSRLKRDVEALEMLGKALERRPDLAEAWLETAQIRLRSKKFDAALADAEKAKSLRPGDPRPMITLANIHAAQGRPEDRIRVLKEAVTLRPGHWESHYLLGVDLAARGLVPEALVEFGQVVKLRPELASGHFNLAVALAKQGMLNDAATHFRETLRLEPNHPNARQYLDKLKDVKPSLGR